MPDIDRIEERALDRAVARLRGGVIAITLAMACGAGLWIATAWLVVRGGTDVGRHLGLLRFYFPGYSVTWSGAFVGLVYGALLGGATGYVLSWIYNRLADWRRA